MTVSSSVSLTLQPWTRRRKAAGIPALVFHNSNAGKLNGRSARRTDDGCRIQRVREVLRSALPDHRHLRAELDLSGGLQAGQVAAMADVARPRRIARMPVPRQH